MVRTPFELLLAIFVLSSSTSSSSIKGLKLFRATIGSGKEDGSDDDIRVRLSGGRHGENCTTGVIYYGFGYNSWYEGKTEEYRAQKQDFGSCARFEANKFNVSFTVVKGGEDGLTLTKMELRIGGEIYIWEGHAAWDPHLITEVKNQFVLTAVCAKGNCLPVNCVVSDWGIWSSACSSNCTVHRSRTIIHPEKFNGTCEERKYLDQSKICIGDIPGTNQTCPKHKENSTSAIEILEKNLCHTVGIADDFCSRAFMVVGVVGCGLVFIVLTFLFLRKVARVRRTTAQTIHTPKISDIYEMDNYNIESITNEDSDSNEEDKGDSISTESKEEKKEDCMSTESDIMRNTQYYSKESSEEDSTSKNSKNHQDFMSVYKIYGSSSDEKYYKTNKDDSSSSGSAESVKIEKIETRNKYENKQQKNSHTQDLSSSGSETSLKIEKSKTRHKYERKQLKSSHAGEEIKMRNARGKETKQKKECANSVDIYYLSIDEEE